MPLFRPLSGTAIAIVIACLAATGPSATPAFAASCNYTQTDQLFAPWGDTALYTPFQGSGFENGASGWSWGNQANIVNGDSNPLLGAQGSHSVQLPGGGTARSPWMCVNASTPTLRFFLRRTSGTGSITINGVVSSGTNKVTTITTVSAGGTWQPSPIVVFPPSLTASTTGMNVQFQFTADPGTTYRIDDIELDPYLRR
jgi:hypothetical protein